MSRKIETLTRERDEARAERDQAQAELIDARRDANRLKIERDEADEALAVLKWRQARAEMDRRRLR